MFVENSLIKNLKGWLNKLGFDLVKTSSKIPADFEPSIVKTIAKVKPFTMTSQERIYTLCEAVKYIVNNNISGDIVECGVWKGGSMMAVADTLLNLNDRSRNLYLFDTFDGMTEPSDKDVDYKGIAASKFFWNFRQKNQKWCAASLEEAQSFVYSIKYDKNKIHFIQGKVEDTIPEQAPSKIALLRLDTDWYESTRHELIHLFPRLSTGGVIIIDDYGYWQGARRAVDEYIEENKIPLLLNRIDFTGRIGVVLK
jgi:O-methyltransferase